MSNTRPPRLPALAQNFGQLASPPPLAIIVARAFASCALAMRAQLDSHDSSAAAAELFAAAREWLQRHAFDLVLDADEVAALATAPGQLDAATRERYALLGEAAGVLGWALRRNALPAPDAAIDAADAAANLGFLSDEGVKLRTTALLRDRDETARYADIAGALHWRLQHQITQPGPVLMSRWRSDQMNWPADVTAAEFVDDDLGIAGRAVTRLTNSELLPPLQLAVERHRAAMWLLGQNRDYWSVTAQVE